MQLDTGKRLALLAGAITLVFYLLPWRKDRGGGDVVPAELIPIAVLHGHGFYLDEFRGSSTDLPYYFSTRQGRVISNYPILPGVVNVPAFTAARVVGWDLYHHRQRLSWLTAVSLTSASVVFFCLWIMRLGISNRQAFWWTLVYSLGTGAWSIGSTSINQHGPSLFFLTLGSYFMTFELPVALVASGLAFGFAVMNRPANIALVLPLAVFVIWRSRSRAGWFIGGAAVPAGLLAWYSTAYWGTVTSLGQGPAILFHGAVLKGMVGLLFSPARGLFVFSPIFLLSLLAIPFVLRRGGLYVAICCGLAFSLLLYSRWSMWWGGGSFGYRLLTEHSPFLVLLAATFWAQHGGKVLLAVVVALGSLSVFIHGLGAFLYPSGWEEGIDTMTSKLWEVSDTELTRLSRIAAEELGVVRALPPPPGPAGAILPTAPTWWSSERDDGTIPGWPDAPNDGQVVKGALTIDGWAISASGPVEVQALIDGGRIVVPATTRLPRPDVARVFPYLGDTSRAGFRAVVAPPKDLEAGEHFITFEMRAPSGKVRRVGPFRFCWSRD